MQKGLLAEMGAVGARGGAKEGRQEWEEVGSRAPGQGARRGAGTGVRSLSAAPGPQVGSLPSQDTSRVCPRALFTPHPDLLAAPH